MTDSEALKLIKDSFTFEFHIRSLIVISVMEMLKGKLDYLEYIKTVNEFMEVLDK